MQHQRDGIDFLVNNGGVGAFYWDVGTGKTLGALATYEKFRGQTPNLKLMVICPLSLIESAWGAEIKKHTRFSYRNLNQKQLGISDGYNYPSTDIYILNFEYLISKNKLDTLIRFLKCYKWMCVIDESSKLKNNTSKTTKTILKLKNLFVHRIVMSGTPAPNSEMEYWGQMTFLKDRIFHPNFYAFRNTYFDMRRGMEIIPGQVLSRLDIQELYKKGYKYYLRPENQKRLAERIRPYCHLVKKSECMDLPEQIDQYRVFQLGEDQKKIYKDMKEAAIAEIINESPDPDYIVAKIALTKLIKLRQIISGFAIDAQGATLRMKTNPKLDELKDLLEDIGDAQAIIWCNFKKEIEDVSQMVGDRACFMWGEVPVSEREQAVIDFRTGKKQFLVANPASAGHGLTFVNASIEIFYSMDFSYEKYEQARGRIHRYGQKNNCLYIHLMGEDTIDGYILDVLKKKKTIDESVKDFISERNRTV